MNDDLKFLYYIDCKVEYKDLKAIKNDILYKVPVLKETKYSYYVPKINLYKTAEEFLVRYGEVNNRNTYLVKKENFRAKISDYGYTHRQYYEHPYLAEESYFVNKNAYKISKALEHSRNPYLLRQVAHNLEIDDLDELKVEEKEKIQCQ